MSYINLQGWDNHTQSTLLLISEKIIFPPSQVSENELWIEAKERPIVSVWFIG